MRSWPFSKGLHDLGGGCFAYLQPDGGWGLSNAGLVVSGDQSLLVDTLTDLPLTRDMLASMKSVVHDTSRIQTVVNTHAHPDHTSGNVLLPDAEIISSKAAYEEMVALAGFDPFADLMRNWRERGDAGLFLHEVMGSKFALNEAPTRFPTRTFSERLSLEVGGLAIELIKVGPAHTKGDVLVFVPSSRIVFTGDVLFHKVHPSIVGVSVSDWINACEAILAADVDIVVPGHGPIGDKNSVRGLQAYLRFMQHEAKQRYDAGMNFEAAARDISMDACRGWADEERIVLTVAGLYREFGAKPAPMPDVLAAALRYRRERTHAVDCACELHASPPQ